ncbi:hypothetical protein HPB50_018251 [Hyalomma asiaticum]|uniref:Uncharacterized protein n=1 Tax=Hyalomma asiaticum TaxID=266040 RepID=A0ACB7SKX6_HYAAI|nr:hypothetical protein HPB50_018251 [Hyalomma asiaticum]
MEAGEGSPPIDDGGGHPSSFLNLTGSEAYPKRALVSDDPSLVVPFPCLPGEAVEFLGRSTQGVVALSSYRFFLAGPEQQLNLPLGLLEAVECRDIFYLHLICKDARSFRCSFATNEDCQKWHKRLTNAIQLPSRLDDLFAFRFYLYCRDERYDDLFSFLKSDRPSLDKDTSLLHQECKRMGFDTDLGGTWKITSINEKFKHHLYGTVIARSAQPEVGWLGWRSPQDETLIQAIADACSIDPGPAICNGLDSLPDDQRLDSDASDLSLLNGGLTASMHFEPRPAPQHKMLILDARSYTAAVANRAKGGGCECPEYYPNCEVQFMSLANIHTIRKSFHAVRALCSSTADQSCWMSTLESSKWLHHLSGLLKAALVVANAVDLERRPVLVHCSDGWDRTPQIVALAELILDPYYRTTEGFQVLVEKEWLEFGHKFGDRCGNSATADDLGERCPVFLQWLDCVHQLLAQFPCGFQFNQQYLVRLAQHTYSGLFGDFLGNSAMERQREAVATRTFSVWTFLKARREQYHNHLYSHTDQVLRPRCQVRDLHFWSEVYLQPSTGLLSQGPPSTPPSEAPEPAEETPPEPAGSGDTSSNLVKTKSVDSLFAGSQSEQSPPPEKHQRRLSDPSLKGLQSELHGGHDETATPLAHRRSLSNGALNGSHEEVQSNNKSSPIAADSAEENEQQPEQQQQQQHHTVSSIEDSTDTLVSEVGETCTSAVTEAREAQGEKEEDVPVTAEAMMSSALSRQTHLLSNTASTSTTDISSSAVYVSPEVASEDLPSNKCPYWLSHKNGETLLAATRTSLARAAAVNGRGSHYSTPLHSRTPSSGYPATPCDDRLLLDPVASRTAAAPLQQQQFDVDGLACPVDAVQQRLHQMVLENEAKIESLENELRRVRLALERSYLHVNGKEALDCLEDAQLGLDCSGEPPWGGCQDGSSSSELSWEQVDERDARATLWVPDHAASHCRGCNAEFWIGRRRHHCRNCGHVFCGHCASQLHPVPHEQLYQPVRVCGTCFEALRSRPCRPSALVPANSHTERLLAKAQLAAAST